MEDPLLATMNLLSAFSDDQIFTKVYANSYVQ